VALIVTVYAVRFSRSTPETKLLCGITAIPGTEGVGAGEKTGNTTTVSLTAKSSSSVTLTLAPGSNAVNQTSDCVAVPPTVRARTSPAGGT
jgi:hypothetical protein